MVRCGKPRPVFLRLGYFGSVIQPIRWLIPTAFLLVSLQLVSSSSVGYAKSGCRHSNRVSAGATIGSQVDGDIVTICLDKSLLKKISPKVQPNPKAPGAPARPIVKPKPVPKPRPVVKTVPVHKVAPKPKPKARYLNSNRANNGVFKPRVTPPKVAPTQILPGDKVGVTVAQSVQLGHATLLGSPVVVRFTPIRLAVDFSDGSLAVNVSGAALALDHRYTSSGRYPIALRVTFRVEYRLKTGTWYTDPDVVELTAPTVQVTVGDAPTESGANVVLVTP